MDKLLNFLLKAVYHSESTTRVALEYFMAHAKEFNSDFFGLWGCNRSFEQTSKSQL